MKNKLIHSIAFCITFFNSVFFGQGFSDEVSNDLAAWDAVVLQLPVTDRFHLTSFNQMRNNNNLGDAERLLIMAGADYFLDKNKHWYLGGGYGWTPAFRNDFMDEHRIYEQMGCHYGVKNGQLSFRARLTQRFVEGIDGVPEWSQALLQYSHPLLRTKSWYWVASNEVFVQFNDVEQILNAGFDQNRLYLGVGKSINNHLKLEAGYMMAWLYRKPPVADRFTHTIISQLVIH